MNKVVFVERETNEEEEKAFKAIKKDVHITKDNKGQWAYLDFEENKEIGTGMTEINTLKELRHRLRKQDIEISTL